MRGSVDHDEVGPSEPEAFLAGAGAFHSIPPESLEDLIGIRGMNQTLGWASARTEGTRPGSARRSSP